MSSTMKLELKEELVKEIYFRAADKEMAKREYIKFLSSVEIEIRTLSLSKRGVKKNIKLLKSMLEAFDEREDLTYHERTFLKTKFLEIEFLAFDLILNGGRD